MAEYRPEYNEFVDRSRARGYQDCASCDNQFNQQKMPVMCSGCCNMMCIECCVHKMYICKEANHNVKLCENCVCKKMVRSLRTRYCVYMCARHAEALRCVSIQVTNGLRCSLTKCAGSNFCKRHRRYNRKHKNNKTQ